MKIQTGNRGLFANKSVIHCVMRLQGRQSENTQVDRCPEWPDLVSHVLTWEMGTGKHATGLKWVFNGFANSSTMTSSWDPPPSQLPLSVKRSVSARLANGKTPHSMQRISKIREKKMLFEMSLRTGSVLKHVLGTRQNREEGWGRKTSQDTALWGKILAGICFQGCSYHQDTWDSP